MENLIGKKVKIVANMANHGFKIGEEVTIMNINNQGGCGGALYNAKNRRNQQYQVYESDFKIPCFTKEEVEKEIVEIQKKIDEHQAKIDTWKEVMNYMTETGVDKYDEVEFKSYRVLKTINQNTSDVEKAKMIAKIINGDF